MKDTIQEKTPAIAEEIEGLMAGIIAAAEHGDVERTFSHLSHDPENRFFLNNRHYDRIGLLASFRESYRRLKSQKIRVRKSEVKVLCPEAAIWIGYGDGGTEPKGGGIQRAYSFTETWVWQKSGGRWSVTHYHESSG